METISNAQNYSEVPQVINIPSDFQPKYMPETFTELDAAREFLKFTNGNVLHNELMGYLCFDGALWQPDETGVQRLFHSYADAVRNDAGEFFKHCASEKGDTCNKYTKFANSLRSETTMRHVLLIAKASCQKPACAFDAQPELFNMLDGVVDLRTSEIKPHSPSYYFSHIAPISMSEADFDLWDDFLNQITLGEIELKDYLQYLGGSILWGAVYEEKLYVFLGDGANGKSTLCQILMSILGVIETGYAVKLSSDVFCRQQFANIKPQLATLRGARLAVATEIERGATFSEAAIKQLCSRDRILAERKYCAPESYMPTHTLILTVNTMPTLSTADYGMRRRIAVIPFKARFEGSTDNRNKGAEIAEKAGCAVLKWMIDGARMFFENSFSMPYSESVDRATKEYFDSCDSVSAWLTQFVEKSACEFTKTSLAYKSYQLSAGNALLDRRLFRERLKQEGYVIKKLHGDEVFSGFRIK